MDCLLFRKAIEIVEMVVEDSGKLDGSDHNLIWSEVILGRKSGKK